MHKSFMSSLINCKSKYFSTDCVFQNEMLDDTYQAKFHQIKGSDSQPWAHSGHLRSVLREFFTKLEITQLCFKPAYHPYLEPSMDVFSYHQGLKNWVEVGNSGVLCPEMLLPMGFPENVSVPLLTEGQREERWLALPQRA
ncbi:Phenylalanyl-tRNA synthetase alpha chain [Cricetulus griseus]|uniref:Phenylalanyl-tRNA synthetase alpha chain n=1 Tax=Cricetulus griseus TaxID=10029 RepID=G3H880_CRIGR|nr:Phenylalanyl-tRNA synthetase alpha chain [Cricetulus griseus]